MPRILAIVDRAFPLGLCVVVEGPGFWSFCSTSSNRLGNFIEGFLGFIFGNTITKKKST